MIDLDAFEGPLDDAAREAGISREEALKRALVALAEANDIDVPTVDELAAVDERVEALDDAAASDDDVERIRAVLGALGETTEGLESTVETATADLETLRSTVGSLDGDVEELTGRIDSLEAGIDELSDGVGSLEADLDDKIEDLRDRVVRVYRDVERKAAAEHAHPEIESTVDELSTTVEALGAALDEVESRLEAVDEGTTAVDDRVSALESRFEEELARDADVDEKLSRVASAVVGVQRRLGAVERRTAGRERLATLTAAANRHGVRKADCGGCHGTVTLGLLTKPECPHCNREFGDLEPKSGFFGTSTLTVGDPPALEGDVSTDGSTDRSVQDGARGGRGGR